MKVKVEFVVEGVELAVISAKRFAEDSIFLYHAKHHSSAITVVIAIENVGRSRRMLQLTLEPKDILAVLRLQARNGPLGSDGRWILFRARNFKSLLALAHLPYTQGSLWSMSQINDLNSDTYDWRVGVIGTCCR